MIIKTDFKSFLSSLLLGLFLLASGGCSIAILSSKSSETNGTGAGTSETSSVFSLEKVAREPKIVVVLLHGLNMNNKQSAKIEKALINNYGDEIVIVKPTYRESQFLGVPRSVSLPLDHSWMPSSFKFLRGCGFPTQLNGICKQIEDALKKSDEPIASDKVILIGISQGGPLAIMVADRFDCAGVVTINATLEGVFCLQNKIDDVSRFLSNCKAGLKEIGFDDKGIETIKNNSRKELLVSKVIPGIRSILPNSSCVKKVMQILDKALRPHLLIGSCTNQCFDSISTNPEHYYGKNTVKCKGPYSPVSDINLEKAFAKLITGSENGYHDGLIATSSQLHMKDDEIKYLEENKIKKDGNIYRVLLKGPPHAEVIVPIASDPKIVIDTRKAGAAIANDPRVAERIIDFIELIKKNKENVQK